MSDSDFSKHIISWYEENKRDLPWRKTTDPYKIWLSEIILQQTRIVQGLPYYLKFVETFSDVNSLAKASQEKVMRLWEGLGYYSRARNLHKCAKQVSAELNGMFPSTFEGLKELPGVGPYTAAAIASIAFKEPVAVVDGNVFRVLARVFGIDKDINSNQGKLFFFEKATQLIDKRNPDLFNQALMEFGALHCLPQNPKCTECIFSKTCFANHKEMQAMLPIKIKKQKIRKRYFTYLMLEYKDRLIMRKRGDGDIWNSLYDFPLHESKKWEKPEAVIHYNSLKKINRYNTSKVFKHILSHQHLNVRFIQIQLTKTEQVKRMMEKGELKFYSKKRIADLPKPILITRYLQHINYLE